MKIDRRVRTSGTWLVLFALLFGCQRGAAPAGIASPEPPAIEGLVAATEEEDREQPVEASATTAAPEPGSAAQVGGGAAAQVGGGAAAPRDPRADFDLLAQGTLGEGRTAGAGDGYGFGGLGARGAPSGAVAASPRMHSSGETRASAAGPTVRQPLAPSTVAPSAVARPTTVPVAPAARIAQALPQTGVLQTTFVAGSGASARLEDMLDRGVMVGGQHVRLEAFDDLGRLPYPVPGDDAVAVYANLERTQLVTRGERVHLQIALMARQGELPVRPRMDVRLVIDRSGSMSGEKWTHAVAAAHALVDRLGAADTFGLISYSDSASLDLAPARVGDRRAAHASIDRLGIGGGTNIDAALELAEQSAPTRRRANDVLMVVLLSDGVANIGQTNSDLIASRARSMFDAGGVLTTTVGVGTDFDEQTMLSIAREGSGSYHFVRRSEDIARILTDELEERAQAVAQNLRLRIELAPGVVASQVYGSRLLDEQQTADVRATEVATDVRLARELGIVRDRQEDDQRGLRMHFPTFRRGDQHVVLMELEVPAGTDLTSIARVSLDWKDLVHERNDHAAIDVSAERTADADRAVASTDRHVKRTVLAFQAGGALQETAQALERGDVAGAQLALSERIQLLRTASSLWRDRALEHDVQILEQYQRVVASAWPSWGDGSRHTLVLAMNYYGDRRMQ